MPPGLGALLVVLAAAEGPFIKLERVDAGRCAKDGVVSVAFAEVSLEGALRTAPAAEYRLMVDGAAQPSAAAASSTFEESAVPLLVAVVVQANLPYRADFPKISDAVQAFLQSLPGRARVSVHAYGNGVQPVSARATGAAAASDFAGIAAADAPQSSALEAFNAALAGLGPADPTQRRLLVVVSDGLDDAPDRAAFRAFGDLARARSVPVHPVAYSATDERGPLLNLGEIAKRSGGTFRWARSAEDLPRELENLAGEIKRQLILDFEVPSRCAQPHRLQVARGTLRSNERGTPAMEAAALPVPLWALVAAGVVGLVLVGLVVRRFVR